jgi:hypothetical protein
MQSVELAQSFTSEVVEVRLITPRKMARERGAREVGLDELGYFDTERKARTKFHE